MTSKVWTNDEIDILKENYTSKGIEKTTELLPKFNAGEVREKADRLGLKRKRKKAISWSNENIEKLKELYPHTLNYDLVEMFSDMDINENDLRRKASALGLKKTDHALELAKQQRMKTRKDGWSDEEVALLRKYYPTHGVKGCMLYIDRTYNSISSKAESEGLWGTVEKYWTQTSITINKDDIFSVEIVYERTDVIHDDSSAE